MHVSYIMHNAHLEMFARGFSDIHVSLPVLSQKDGKLSLVFLGWQGLPKQKNIPAPTHIVRASLVGSSMEVEDIVGEGLDAIMKAPKISKFKEDQLMTVLNKVIQGYLVNHKLPAHLYLLYLEQMVECYSKEYMPLFAAYNIPKYNIKELQI